VSIYSYLKIRKCSKKITILMSQCIRHGSLGARENRMFSFSNMESIMMSASELVNQDGIGRDNCGHYGLLCGMG
jgi:hypothetical protein